jgi:hypothetical protein
LVSSKAVLTLSRFFGKGFYLNSCGIKGFRGRPSAENKTLIFSRIVGFCPVFVILHFGEGIDYSHQIKIKSIDVIALNVGWVERQRNPTLTLNLLGYAKPPTPVTPGGNPHDRAGSPTYRYFSLTRDIKER